MNRSEFAIKFNSFWRAEREGEEREGVCGVIA